jgi:hypothetical protein
VGQLDLSGVPDDDVEIVTRIAEMYREMIARLDAVDGVRHLNPAGGFSVDR